MTALYSFRGILLQTLLVGIIFASSPAEGQNLKDVKVTVKAVNVTFQEALVILEQKTDFKFNFIREEIPLKENVTLSVTDESLYNILEAFANDYGLIFNRINNQITIKKAEGWEKDKIISTVENGSIRGKVTDANTKEPLIGANIFIKNTSIGVTTGIKGDYLIENLKPGEYTIVIKYVGFSTQQEIVTISSNKTVELNFSLISSLVNLDEIVVAGSLSKREIRAVANPITTVTSNEIVYRNSTWLPAVLEAIPGVQLTFGAESELSAHNIMSYISMRGGIPASSSLVKFYIDGIEVSDVTYLELLTPNMIDRIDVLKGPMASTLYGSGSAGGVILITTKKSTSSKTVVNFRSMLTSTSSDYLTDIPLKQDYSLNFSGGSENIGYLIGVSNNRIPYSHYPVTNAIDDIKWSYDANLNGKIENVVANLKFQVVRSEYGSYIDPSRDKYLLSKGISLAPVSFNDLKTKTKGLLGSLHLSQVISDDWYHDLTAGYITNNSDENSNTLISGGYRNNLNSYNKYNLRYFSNFKFPLSTDISIDITSGLEYTYTTITTGYNIFKTPYKDYLDQQPVSGSKLVVPTTTTGIFGEVVWGFFNDLFLTTGLRLENNSGYGENVGSYPQPRIGLTYNFAFDRINMKPRFSWGVSSNPLPPDYAIGKNMNFLIQLPNPELKPQRQSGFEIGADIYYGENIVLNATYYNQKVEDLVSFNLVDNPNTPQLEAQYQNTAAVDNSGFELSGKLVYEQFTLDLSYSSAKTLWGKGTKPIPGAPFVKEGEIFPYLPDGSFFVRLSYQIPAILNWSKKGGSISLEYRYNGSTLNPDYLEYYRALSKWTPPTPYPNQNSYFKLFDGYSKINLRANYYTADFLNLFFDVYNLTNNQEPASGSVYPFPGRSVSFGINISY